MRNRIISFRYLQEQWSARSWKISSEKLKIENIKVFGFGDPVTHFALFDGNGIDYERYHLKTANAKFDKSMASPIGSNGI